VRILTRRATLLASTALVVTLAGMPGAAQAQIAVWGGAGSTTTTSDYNLGTNWDTGTAPVAVGNAAIFDSTGSTAVNVTAPAATGALIFNVNSASQSYVVTGAPIVLFSIAGFTALRNNANAGQAISIANDLNGGASKILQNGASTLTLSGTSTFGAADIFNGTLVNSGNLTITGTILNFATYTNTGTTTGNIDNGNSSGIFNNNSGATLSGSLSQAGVSSTINAGSITGTTTVTGGTFTNNTGGSVAGTTTVTGGTVTNNGGTFAAVDNSAGGHFNNTSGSAGAVSNAATATNGGTVASLGNSAGTFTNNSGGSVTGTATITGGTVTNNGGTLADVGNSPGGTFDNTSGNAGAVSNSGTATNGGTVASLSNNAGTFGNDGTISGVVTVNGGSFTTTGTVGGGLTNNGATVNARGQVNGFITNNSIGLFTVTGNLAGNSSFNNGGTAQLAVSGGNFTGITTLTNGSTNASGISISAGRTLSANNISNNAGAAIDNAGTLTTLTNFSNLGTLNTNTAASVVNGNLTNSGTVNARNQINGAITNNGSGLFTVVGDLAVNSTFGNSGQLAVSGGNLTGITGLTNSSTNATGISISAGRTLSANTITNSVGATINNLGTLTALTSLTNNGTITGAYAMADGTLSGIGNTANLTVNGGTFAPGNGTAGSSMNVTGSLALQSAAVYMVQINPATSSFANVTGAATLGGSTVQAIYANGSYVARQYTILTATGGVSGTFASVADTNLPANFHTTLSYDATHAYLNLILSFIPPPGSGLSGNQNAVGNAIINSFNSNGGISLVYSGLTANGLTQASGETAAGTQQTTFNAMNQFMGLMTDPFTPGRSDGANAPAYAEEDSAANAYASSGKPRGNSERDAYAAVYSKAPLANNYNPRWSVWAAGFGGSQTTDGNVAAGSNTSTSRLFGVAAGADYIFSPRTVAGFALAGGGTSFSVVNGGSGRSDLFQAGAFIRHTVGQAYVTGALAYGWQDVTTDRTVTIAGVDRLRAQFNANAFSGRIEAGYRFVSPWMGGVGITPYAAAQFTTFDLPAYAEQVLSGANTFALAYSSRSVTDTRSELGLRADKSFAMQTAILTLRGRAAWAHDFNPDRAIGATFQTLPGASFVVNGARQASDSALTTASAEVKWMNGWSVAGTFEGEFFDVTRSYAGKGVVRYTW
jgi:uncharacterized protein with beta-barrel porin domain